MASTHKKLFTVAGSEFVCAKVLKVGPSSEMVNNPTIRMLDASVKFKPMPDRLCISVQAGEVEDVTRDKSRISNIAQQVGFNLHIPQNSRLNLFVGRLGDHMEVQNDIALVSGDGICEPLISVVDEYRGRLSTLLNERKHIPQGFENWPHRDKDLWMKANHGNDVYGEMQGLGTLGQRILLIKDFGLDIIQCGDGLSYRHNTNGVLVKINEKETANLKLPDYALAVSNKYPTVSAASGTVFIDRWDNEGSVSVLAFDTFDPNIRIVTDVTTGKPVVQVGNDLWVSFSPA